MSVYSLLKAQGALVDKINLDNTYLAARKYSALEFDDAVIDTLALVLDGSKRQTLEDLMLHVIDNTDSSIVPPERRKIDTKRMVRSLGRFIGVEQADQYVRLLFMRHNGGASGNNLPHDWLTVFKNYQMLTIADMIDIIMLFLIGCITLEEYDSWFKERSDYLSPRLAISISQDMMDKGITVDYLTEAGCFLELQPELMKNIIGSIWNCIIDTIVDTSLNEVEVEGGEQ